MDTKKFIEERIEEIRQKVGSEKAINALSGGVDSSVVTLLGHRAIGDRLKTVFIDTGVMREGESESVIETFKKLGVTVHLIEAQEEFFSAFKGILDPEEKRKAFRNTFYLVLGRAVKESGAKFLLQGTIAADISETQRGVKTQHNILEQIGIDPQIYGFRVIEPLRDLYKDGVREVAKALGFPQEVFERMPFPGPGLSTRIIGEVTPERTAIVRKAVRIVEEEVGPLKPFQAFAVLLSDKATGVTGGEEGRRSFGNIIAIRSTESKDAIQAEVTEIPWEILKKIQRRIVNEIPSIVKVLYDLTPKPPSTIEYI
ncbi:MAG: glutamine-hydrolyzing GMP synthase [Thermodesulfobacteriota bacterium]